MLIRQSHITLTAKRRGVILLVVLALLALLAGVGLGFVYYAESEADAARISRQAQDMSIPDVDPELLMSYYMSQLIYGTPDVNSSMRGHSLARSIYGGHPNSQNDVPFNGTGRLHYTVPHLNEDNFKLIHYKAFPNDPVRNPGQHLPSGQYIESLNAPYTYADPNNFYLGSVTADGTILQPSFHRDYLFGPLDPTNGRWRSDPAVAPADRYLTIRPRPADNYKTKDSNNNWIYHFPAPADGAGDVKNVWWAKGIPDGQGGYYHNDSIWMDLGFPVMNGPGGRKFKPLFAAFVLDMDNRVNLWAAGNLHGGGSHKSNQGFGAWEVNLASVLTAAPGEAVTLLRNRYKNNNNPQGGWPPGTPRPIYIAPPFYSPIDFDGVNAGPLQLRVAGDPLMPFPKVSGQWDNAQPSETDPPDKHASKYNYFLGRSSNQDEPVPTLSNFAGLLRHSGTGSPALTSSLFSLIPTNLRNPRIRNMITPLSIDFHRQGAIPYVWDLNGQSNYEYQAADRHPSGPQQPFPDPSTAGSPPTPPSIEFIANDWRSKLGEHGQLNLNRQLTDFPGPGANGAIDPTLPAYTNAFQERQRFAKELYDWLIRVTGAVDPNLDNTITDAGATQPKYQAVRYLAQLAANMVDYIDSDDYMTEFRWDANDADAIVFGTELPRLVVNEAYVQLDNHTDHLNNNNGMMEATKYYLNFWVELHNPMKDAHPRYNGSALLQLNNPDMANAGQFLRRHNVYQLMLLTKTDTNLRQPDNNIGDFDPMINPAAKRKKMDEWRLNAAEDVVKAANGQYTGPVGGNDGFYVVGPEIGATGFMKFVAGRNPGISRTQSSPKMSLPFDENDPLIAELTGAMPTAKPSILLQRLANPHLPPQSDATMPHYNPYVTIDYVRDLKVNDTRKFDNAGNTPPGSIEPKDGFARGRHQPYAAHLSQWKNQDPSDYDPANGNPRHTFFRHNGKDPTMATDSDRLKVPFDWLFHLDRSVINPLELLHVSGFRPHELTQQFVKTFGGSAHQQRAPWLDQRTRLYRLLEFVTTPNLMAGTSLGGRVPGKININTVWDAEIFQALFDAQAGNHFTSAHVTNVFNSLLQSRTPSSSPGANDRPFLPLSIGHRPNGGQYPLGAGIQDTILRGAAPGNEVSLVNGEIAPMIRRVNTGNPAEHPYQTFEMLTKIYNNITTRSNVFAVWATVGFFEVHPDTNGNYTQLGKEVGRADNRHVRHRFFALIDRTAIHARLTQNLQLAAAVAAGTDVTLPLNNSGNNTFNYTTANGGTWQIRDGASILIVDPNTGNSETVRVKSTAGGSLIVDRVAYNHPANAEVLLLGYTGPVPRYHPRNDRQVVRFYSVIE